MATSLVELGPLRGLKRYRDDRLALLAELGEQPCDLVRTKFASIELFIVTAAPLVQEVLIERAAHYKKSRALARFAKPLLGDGLVSAEGDVHKRHRKLLASAFQSRTIARYADDMVAMTTAMLAAWKPGEARDFAEDINGLTIRVAAKTMFGESDVPVHEVSASFDIANRWIMESASSLLPLPLGLPTPRNIAMRRALKNLDDIVYAVIAKKRDRGGEGDILSTLLAAQDDENNKLTDLEVRDEVMTFFMAGHETTATSLSWLFHVLATHPEIHAKLLEELDRVLGGRTPTPDDLEELVYLRQVTLETMRLYPPVYMIGREAIVATEIAGHPVKRGSYVLINTLGMHRRADYFNDPRACVPERFVDGDPPAPRGGFIPFGLGPRVCIGNQFAMMQIGLLAATIFQRCMPAATGATITRDPLITLRPSPGLPFVVNWR